MSKIRIALGAVALAALIACGAPSRTDRVLDQPLTTPTTGAPVVTAKPSKAGKPVSVEQSEATESAASYLSGQNFSRKGLIKQLAYEGYSNKAASAAVDSLNVDWNAQAVNMAREYLGGQSFSRKGLTAQLEYEGFTHDQAVHGVKGAGL